MSPRADKREGTPQPIGTALEQCLRDLELLVPAKEHMAPLYWAEAVGDFVARHTAVDAVRHGTLYVRADSSALAQQLQLQQQQVLHRLNERLGGKFIAAMRIRTAALGRSPAVARETAASPGAQELAEVCLRPVELDQIDAICAAIEDTELREAVHRIMVTEARLRAWRRQQGLRLCETCGGAYDPREGFCRTCASIREGAQPA